MDRLSAMRAFICVVNESTFSRAAERLDMSPQLVSKYIAWLEQELGVRLLNRTTRKVHLTEAGERYYQRASQLLDDLDDLENQLGDWHLGPQGLLKISAPVSFATRHMATLLCDFQRQHPAISVDLQLNDRKVDIVEEGFDVALRIGHLKSSSLIARKIAPVRLVLCASPHYLADHGTPQTLADLANHHYLRYSYIDQRDQPLHDALMSGRGRDKPMAGDIVCNNGDVLTEAAIQGAGIALQPTFIAGPALADGRLQRILIEHEPEPMGLYAVYAHRQLLPSKVKALIDFMENYYGDVPWWDRF